MKRCGNCGQQNEGDNKYCTYCGKAIEKNTKKIIFVVIGVMICATVAIFAILQNNNLKVTGTVKDAKIKDETNGSEQEYLPNKSGSVSSMQSKETDLSDCTTVLNKLANCIVESDVEGILELAQCEKQAKEFNVKKLIRRNSSVNPELSYMPFNFENFEVYNTCLLEKKICNQMKMLYGSLLLQEEQRLNQTLEGITLEASDDSIIDLWHKELELDKLEGLEICSIDYANPQVQDNENTIRNHRRPSNDMNYRGMQDLRGYSILYSYKGNYFLGGVELLYYEDINQWLVNSLYTMFEGESINGGVSKINEDIYRSEHLAQNSIMLDKRYVFSGQSGTEQSIWDSDSKTGSKDKQKLIEKALDCIVNADVKEYLKLCAFEEKVCNFNTNIYWRNLGAIHPLDKCGLPPENGCYTKINYYIFKEDYIRQLYWLYVSILFDNNKALEPYIDQSPITPIDDNLLDEISEKFNSDTLSQLRVERYDWIVLDDIDSKNQKRKAGWYSGKQIESCSVLYEINGRYYKGGLQIIELDNGRWKIFDCTLYPLGSEGDLEPITKDEYLRNL